MYYLVMLQSTSEVGSKLSDVMKLSQNTESPDV